MNARSKAIRLWSLSSGLTLNSSGVNWGTGLDKFNRLVRAYYKKFCLSHVTLQTSVPRILGGLRKMKNAIPAHLRFLMLAVLILNSCAMPAIAFYHPEQGRWINRDPIGEQGGENLYRFIDNNPIMFFDSYGLLKGYFGMPQGSPFIRQHESDSAWGLVFPPGEPMDNKCSCECKNNKSPVRLACELSFIYTMSILEKDAPLWAKAPPPYPSEPTPTDWDSWSFGRKKQFIVDHEQKHVKHYREWYDKRRDRIEVFESLQYPSMSDCQMRADVLVKENRETYKEVRQQEASHGSWK